MSALRASTRRRCPGCNLPGVSLYNINSRTTRVLAAAALKICTITIKPNDGLALALFVLWILTNDSDATFSFDNFAFLADRFYRRSNLHDESSFLCSLAPRVGEFSVVRKKSTRKSSFYSIAFCSRKCKKFFTYFFIFFCSFSVHFFISPTGKKKNRRDRFLFSVPPVFYR